MSKYFRDSGNIFDNQEPTFNSENVHWHIEYMKSRIAEDSGQWCYKIEQAIVDDKPTNHYCVVYWWNKWGLSKQHLYFLDTSLDNFLPKISPVEKAFKAFLKWRDNPVIREDFNNLIDIEYFTHFRSEEKGYVRYGWVTPAYMGKLVNHLFNNGIPFTRSDDGNKVSAILDIPHGNWIETAVQVEFYEY